MFLMDSSSNLDFSNISGTSAYFLEIQYLSKGRCFLTETFRIFQGSIDLSMNKVYVEIALFDFLMNTQKWVENSVKLS
jgi:hypothetical protein